MSGTRATADPVARLAGEIVASYETRVCAVEQAVSAAHEMLDTFRSQGEDTRRRLQEQLARTASLRRHDFDAMMRGILALQEQREERVKEAVRGYLAEQRSSARSLGESLASGAAGMRDVAARLHAFEAAQEARATALASALAACRREQERVSSALGQLLSNGLSIRVTDLKAALKTIQPLHPTGAESERVRT